MENRAPQLLAVTILLLGLSWISVLLRCWVRVRVIKAFYVDDWLTVLALLLFTAYAAFVFVAVRAGSGRHMKDMSLDGIIVSLKMWYFGEIFYILASAELRLTVGIFLLKFTARKPPKVVIQTLNAVNIMFNIYYLLQAILQCRPLSHYWTRVLDPRGGTCLDPEIAMYNTYAQSGLATLIDGVFAIIPLWLLKDLQISTKKKIGVGAVMGLGAMQVSHASVATIIRFPYISSLAHKKDFLWYNVDMAIWSTAEVGIGLTSISLATLRPLLRSFLIKVGLSSGGSETYLFGTANNHAYMRHTVSDGLPLNALSPIPSTPGLASGLSSPGYFDSRPGTNERPDGRSGAGSARGLTPNPEDMTSPIDFTKKKEPVSFWNLK